MTWVGYATGVDQSALPSLKNGAIQPFYVLPGYEPSAAVKMQINDTYAQHYAPLTDINLILKNYRYLGGR